MLTKAQCKLFLCRALRLTPSDSLISFQNGVRYTRTRRRVSERRYGRRGAQRPHDLPSLVSTPALKRPYRATADSVHSLPLAPNLLERCIEWTEAPLSYI